MGRRLKRIRQAGKSRQMLVSCDLVKIQKQINNTRKEKKLRPLSMNKITKYIAIKIKRGEILPNEFIKI